MRIHGLVQPAELTENPVGSDRIELVLRVQGVGPGHPRVLVVPFDLLLADAGLDPDAVTGRGFEAEVDQDEDGRWLVRQVAFTARVLRPRA